VSPAVTAPSLPVDLRALLEAERLVPGSLLEPRPCGRRLHHDVVQALAALGIRATCHRRGPFEVEVELPSNWPTEWRVAEVLPRLLNWRVRCHGAGLNVLVRLLPRYRGSAAAGA
tara:strand:+ start:31 stop:375 length:345 start_codon:yes stop_codon:yes gene_type:complete